MDEREHRTEDLDEIDLTQLLRVLYKWRWAWIGIALVAVLSAAVLSYFVLPPVYRAEMTLLVANATAELPRATPQEQTLEDLVNPLVFMQQITIKTYVAQLTSPRLLLRVRDRVGLDPQLYDETTLAGMVKAEQIRDTNLIRVTVEHTDPLLARRVAEVLAEEFFKVLEEDAAAQLERSVELIQRQIEATQRELEQAVAALTKARSDPRSAALLQKEYETKQRLLDESRGQLAAREVQAEALRQTVARLEAELARTPPTVEVQERGEAGTTTRTEPNPAYQQLQELRQQRLAELAQADTEVRVLRERLQQLQGEVQRLQAELVAAQAREEGLARQVEHLKRTHDLLSQRLAEAKALRAGNLAETRVVLASPPLTPTTPVRPRKLLNMAVAGMLGLMLGFVVAFVLERLDVTVKNAEDVERLIRVPVLGEVPEFAGPGR